MKGSASKKARKHGHAALLSCAVSINCTCLRRCKDGKHDGDGLAQRIVVGLSVRGCRSAHMELFNPWLWATPSGRVDGCFQRPTDVGCDYGIG